MTGHGLSLVFKDRSKAVSTTRNTEAVEVIMRDQRRRRRSLAEKAALVRRTYEPGMSVSLVARQEGVAASLLFQWRKLERQGALTTVSAGEAVVPASELAAARAQIAKLQRVLGKKTLENEILKEAVEYAAEKSGLRARHCWTGTASEGRLRGAGVSALEHSSLARSPRILGRRPNTTHGACKRRDLARRDQGADHRVVDLWLSACLRIGEPPAGRS